jgi:hypothetical protein
MELQCRDDRGTESQIVRRVFYTKSNKPVIDVSTSKGGLNRKTDPHNDDATIVAETGTGIKFNFAMIDDDPYVDKLDAWYYEYRFGKRPVVGDTTAYTYPGETGDQWLSTLGSANVKSIIVSASDEYGMNLLIPDARVGYAASEITTETVLQVRGYDEAGVVSDVKDIFFRCLEGYNPSSNMYCSADTNDVFCLGEYHYSYGLNSIIKVVKPRTSTYYDGEHFSHPLFFSQDSTFSTIWSDDIVIYSHAGYRGEFDSEKPTGKKQSKVLDETTGLNYYSEAIAFGYQLDGEAYIYPAYVGNDNYYPEGTGEGKWFQLRVGEALAQSLPIRNLTPGDHTLRIRVLDSQGVWDPTPYEFKFRLIENIPVAERTKDVLVIDNDNFTGPGGVEEKREEFYRELFAGYNVDFANYSDIKDAVLAAGQEALQYSKAKISPSDLVQYKTVFYHMDNVTSPSQDLFLENQSFNLFLQAGGNLVVSGGMTIDNLQESFNSLPRNIVTDHMGVPTDVDDYVYCDIVSGNAMTNRFFVGATPVDGSGLNTSVELDTTDAAVGGLITGLNDDATGLISYFNTSADNFRATPIMKMSYVDTYLDTADSAAVELYNRTKDKACAIRYDRVNPGTGQEAKTYVFGFPISMVELDQAKALVSEVLAEMGITK